MTEPHQANGTAPNAIGPRCPKPVIAWLGSHTMRLERSDGERDIWRCVSCGHTELRPFPTSAKGANT